MSELIEDNHIDDRPKAGQGVPIETTAPEGSVPLKPNKESGGDAYYNPSNSRGSSVYFPPNYRLGITTLRQ